MTPGTTTDLQMRAVGNKLAQPGGMPLADEKSITSLGRSRSRAKSLSAPIAAVGQPPPSDFVRVRFDAFELDEANARLLRYSEPIAVAPTPFAVLCALVRQPGELISKNALLDAVWGHRFVSDSVLKTAISELRTALADDARQPRYIETVSRRGYRFIGVTSAITTAQLPHATAVTPAANAPAIIGRMDALARLRAAWSRTCAGERSVVWVVGDPGIGKTTLIDHFAASLGEVAIARGQCIEQYGAGEPFFPVLEALAALCRSDSAALPLLRAVAPGLLLQFPWLCTPQERNDLGQERAGVHPYRMLRELGEFFDRYTERRPLLLVTENLCWSDRATVQLIDHIARRRGHARLMWLASFRVADVIASDHPLKAVRNELRLHGLCEEIQLDSFSEQEVADYVAHRAPLVAVSEPFVRALHERTDGLPLFLTHVVSDLIARGALGDGTASLGMLRMTVPENLAQIIDHYVARLTHEQRVVLEAAAVCGVEFRVETVAAALGIEVAAVAAICDDVARGQLWLAAAARDPSRAPTLPYSFRHSLFREVLYERIGALARVQLHRKVGMALEREREVGTTVTAAEHARQFERGDEIPAAPSPFAEVAFAF